MATHSAHLDLIFPSGMSRVNDFSGARDASVPIGVVAGELTVAQLLMTIPRALDAGIPVFVDTGAFSAFQTQAAIDWPEIFRRYDVMADLTQATRNLYLVAPDVVGNQDATLRILTEWQVRVHSLIKRGCRIIVPLQAGSMSARQMHITVRRILLTDQFIVGIPSNRAALSIDECATLKHHAFHILGRVQNNDDQFARIAALRVANPEAIISADANWIRSRLAKLSQLAGNIRSANVVQRTKAKAAAIERHHRTVAITKLIAGDDWGSQLSLLD